VPSEPSRATHAPSAAAEAVPARVDLEYLSAAVAIEGTAELVDHVHFIYHDFVARRRSPETPRYRIGWNRRERLYTVRFDGEPMYRGPSENQAIGTLDYCIRCHLLGDLEEDLVFLHAAALAAPDGGTILVPAPSGGGKSTLTAALLGLGYTLLSDDHLPLERRTLLPLAFPRAIGLDEGTPRFGPGIDAELIVGEPGDTRRWVRASRRRPPGVAGEPVRAAFCVRFAPGARPALEPLSGPQLLARLVVDSPMLEDDCEPRFEALAQLVDSVPAYSLTHGNAGAASRLVLDLRQQERRARG